MLAECAVITAAQSLTATTQGLLVATKESAECAVITSAQSLTATILELLAETGLLAASAVITYTAQSLTATTCGNDVSGQAEVKSAEQFTSGEVCWLLNEEQSEGAWGQKLGTDPCPVLDGPAVFKDGETYYNEEGSAIVETNSEQASFVIVSENLTINIYGSDHEATVFNLAGNIVYKGSERIIPVTTAGMYLVRIGNEVQKTVVR